MEKICLEIFCFLHFSDLLQIPTSTDRGP